MTPDAGAGFAALRFPHATPPAPGRTLEVAPGLRWLRMPLPFALDHINLWLVEDGAGWAIVDTGIDDAVTREIWEQIFARELDGRPVTRLFCTHYHPDHMGLAGWLTERLGIELWATETEWRFAHERSRSTEDGVDPAMVELCRRVGLEDALAAAGALRGSHYRMLVAPVPDHHHRLTDDMTLPIGGRAWRVVIGRGHAPEHACLFCPELDLFIAGDQVLPKISPNVGLWPMDRDPDPLGSFLASLDRLRRALPASSLVLPSHNLPFYGLHNRLGQLTALHGERLREIETACQQPRSAAEIMPLLFARALDPHQLAFAVGETLAHLEHATRAGRLQRRERPDGVWMFQRA